MSDVLAWTVARIQGRAVVIPKAVANLPHRVYTKRK
jgi:hypothetical protein